MPSIKVKDTESFDAALRRFKRTCERAGTILDVRKKEFFEKPSIIGKRKRGAAVKRQEKKVERELNKRVRMY